MEDSTDEYTLAACIEKLKNFKGEPQKCPDPKCDAEFAPNHALAHFLADHQDLEPIRINCAIPQVLNILPQKWPLDEVQVLALLCFEGRNGHASCTPVATKLCEPNILLATDESYVTSLPMLLMGCRTTTAILCNELPPEGTYKSLGLYAIWIQTCEKSRPLVGKLTLRREGTLASAMQEFEVQTFGQENCDTVKNMLKKTDDYMRLFEGNINCISDGQEVPLTLEIAIKDYADPWFGHVKPDVLTNPYEAAIDNFKVEVLKEILAKREEEEKGDTKKDVNLINLEKDDGAESKKGEVEKMKQEQKQKEEEEDTKKD